MSRQSGRGWHSDGALNPGDPRWRRLRQRKLDDVGWRCERCGRAGRLECHHRVSMADGGEALPDLAGLEIMCRDCHLDHHGRGKRQTLTDSERRWSEFVEELLP